MWLDRSSRLSLYISWALNTVQLNLWTDKCCLQSSWSLRSILERAWSSEAAVEEQKWSERWARRCRSTLRHRAVRVVLRGRDRWERIYSDRIPRLSAEQQNQLPFCWWRLRQHIFSWPDNQFCFSNLEIYSWCRVECTRASLRNLLKWEKTHPLVRYNKSATSRFKPGIRSFDVIDALGLSLFCCAHVRDAKLF